MSASTSARVSRGCLPCRTRRVKCDQALPSCKRCVQRNEPCEGYRDDTTLLFRSENEKVARRVLSENQKRRSSVGSSSRSNVSTSSNPSIVSLLSSTKCWDYSTISKLSSEDLNKRPSYPWVKSAPEAMQSSAEDEAVSKFFKKFVMYPCNDGSSPGFLEHLPSLFKGTHIEGRAALRLAVRATAYAGLIVEKDNVEIRRKSLDCYGEALNALSDAIKDLRKEPDDYVLMTIVVLDIFESLYLKNEGSSSNHTGGMAGILRLRGTNQMYGSRGWSLFRLSYHRLQKEQLAFGRPPLQESDEWLQSLNEELPEVWIEKQNHCISQVCDKARHLLKGIQEPINSIDRCLEIIREMHEVDKISVSWRSGRGWSFRTIHRSELAYSNSSFPEYIQLHPDVWISYEWNYFRTARIILHRHLLECLDRIDSLPLSTHSETIETLVTYRGTSMSTIRFLIDEILATVPQSLGDIDNQGRKMSGDRGHILCKGVGGYFLLWPIRVLKGSPLATEEQTSLINSAFERIRECTGMKAALGAASDVGGL